MLNLVPFVSTTQAANGKSVARTGGAHLRAQDSRSEASPSKQHSTVVRGIFPYAQPGGQPGQIVLGTHWEPSRSTCQYPPSGRTNDFGSLFSVCRPPAAFVVFAEPLRLRSLTQTRPAYGSRSAGNCPPDRSPGETSGPRFNTVRPNCTRQPQSSGEDHHSVKDGESQPHYVVECEDGNPGLSLTRLRNGRSNSRVEVRRQRVAVPYPLAHEGRRRVDSSLMTCYASVRGQRISFVGGESDG